MKVSIRQIRGKSGVDVWAHNFCRSIQGEGHVCDLDFQSPISLFIHPFPSFLQCREHYDIIQSNSPEGHLYKGDCPLVVTEHLVVHDPALAPYKSPAQKLYHRWIFRCERKTFDVADAVVSVSQYTRQKVEEIFGISDTEMIYNGVDSAFFRPQNTDRAAWGIPEDKCVLLYTGNLTRRKGADLLPSIMKQLGDRFLLLTTSGNRNKSQNYIPCSRNIGYVNPEELVLAYNLCDIFIIPSRMEGLSLSTLEAMACGKPVVAFNCSSFPELVEDGKGGCLCRKEDVKEFSERIISVAGEPELARRMGAFNRERVLEKFSLETMTKGYISLYRSL